MTAFTIIVLAVTAIASLARKGSDLNREANRADAWTRFESEFRSF